MKTIYAGRLRDLEISHCAKKHFAEYNDSIQDSVAKSTKIK